MWEDSTIPATSTLCCQSNNLPINLFTPLKRSYSFSITAWSMQSTTAMSLSLYCETSVQRSTQWTTRPAVCCLTALVSLGTSPTSVSKLGHLSTQVTVYFQSRAVYLRGLFLDLLVSSHTLRTSQSCLKSTASSHVYADDTQLYDSSTLANAERV